MAIHYLDPVAEPIGIFGQFVSREQQTLALKEKIFSLSGDSFDVKLANGQVFLKVTGSVMSLSDRKSVEDAYGNHLFDIGKEHFHLHTTYAIKDPNGNKIAEVKSGFALLGSKATATFTGLNGKEVTLLMKGNWSDRTADIVDQNSGQTVARLGRKLFDGREILFGQETYAAVVAPGVDGALIAALCICFDEKNRDE
ncbi:hypothetical protein ASPWEDRAFT_142195 [Aspergillus wentii DTO 134E9]|uniref:DUF567 domain protein n=1 Tax=Aspergillus wentii DTO 134E9 TaxID=1073089 RepID=A0A1L9R552_ASPWE|nr:uncharacterized protein ASPWEDRAFT_142195 [Aspergillus wentii DTO 134E9]KAI9923712.1 hypothetical protein MW887_008339 [Aspergillus wentii]OJJ30065.1 hypothetical protein ASPWEDRAFT_142195 [Aspergillus wentii DTO 134E9]